MTRGQRMWHARVWRWLAPLLGLALAYAFATRKEHSQRIAVHAERPALLGQTVPHRSPL
jgi:hypothetical protein